MSTHLKMVNLPSYDNYRGVDRYRLVNFISEYPLREDALDQTVDITPIETIDEVRGTFYRIARRYFKLRLNQYGQFDNYEDARLASEFIFSVKVISPPNYLDPVPFVPLGVWYVDGPTE